MFQKLLKGFMVIVFSIRGLMGISFAQIEIGNSLQLLSDTCNRLEHDEKANSENPFSPTWVFRGTHPEEENNGRNYTSAGLNYFTTSDFVTLPDETDFYAFRVQGTASVFELASFLAGFDYYFAPISDNLSTSTALTKIGLENKDLEKGFAIQRRLNYNHFGLGYYYYNKGEQYSTGGPFNINQDQFNFTVRL